MSRGWTAEMPEYRPKSRSFSVSNRETPCTIMDKPGIVHLNPRHRVSEYEPAPFRVNPLIIRKEPESTLD
jgi:hypothetical protein